jgi:hypothetical protein
MIYLDSEKENKLRILCPDLYIGEQLQCTCGKTVIEVQGWVSQKHIGVEAKEPCACGRGRLSVSTPRFQHGSDLFSFLDSSYSSTDNKEIQ